MKPLSELTNDAILCRMSWLAKNVYYADSKLCLPSDVAVPFQACEVEIRKRGLLHELRLPEIIQAGDIPPIYGNHLIRYARDHKHLEELMRGRLSFGSAVEYANAELLVAQRDNETVKSVQFANQVLRIGQTDYPTEDFVINWNLTLGADEGVGCFLLSFSREESVKLAREFEARSFVRVHDRKLFCNLVHDAAQKANPRSKFYFGDVVYYDDLSEAPAWKKNEELLFSKRLEFKYQREYRLAVLNGPRLSGRLEVQASFPDGLLELVRIS